MEEGVQGDGGNNKASATITGVCHYLFIPLLSKNGFREDGMFPGSNVVNTASQASVSAAGGCRCASSSTFQQLATTAEKCTLVKTVFDRPRMASG